MLADVQHAEQQLTAIKQLIAQEQYIEAMHNVVLLQKKLQPLFAQLPVINTEAGKRLQQLSEDFFALLSNLNAERAQIKNSISQLAGVKSGNKISKTYQID